MTWIVEFEKQAKKELDKLDKQHARKILRFLSQRISTKEDPRRLGESLKHHLSDFWKYRIGDYRLICDIQDNVVTVLVLKVGHRREVYK